MIQQPLIVPETGWVPPESYPNLKNEKILWTDVEVKDEHLRTLGPGWVRNEGYIAGLAVGTSDRQWYFPIRHAVGNNFDPHHTLRWYKDQIASVNKVGCFNASYDLGWLQHEGVPCPLHVVDVQSSAALLNENRKSYSLENIAKDSNVPGKDEQFLKDALKLYKLKGKGDIWKLPPPVVGPYGEGDVLSPQLIWEKHEKELRDQDLWRVWELEMALVPLNIEMKKLGVRVNFDQAEILSKEWTKEQATIEKQIKQRWSVSPDIWSGDSLGRACDQIGIDYPRTPKTNKPSFTKDVLEHHSHPFMTMVREARKISKVKGTYIDSFIGKYSHNGRIHCDWNPLKSEREDGASIGTVSGRYSAGNPSLQVIPSVEKYPEMGIKVRKLFLPDEGADWACEDYSQQEPRLTVHYAHLLRLRGAAQTVAAYHAGESDFHSTMAKMAGIPRPKAKIIVLGIIYGMGVSKLCANLGLEYDEGKALLRLFNSKAPFMKLLADRCAARAQSKGFITTIGGRRCRFDKWEIAGEWDEDSPPPTTEERMLMLQKDPISRWYNKPVRRAFTHKALNRLIQGSAGDQTKMAMLECYKQGRIPHIQMHDELDFSVSSRKEAEMIGKIMREVVPISVPMDVDIEIGPSWGEVKEAA